MYAWHDTHWHVPDILPVRDSELAGHPCFMGRYPDMVTAARLSVKSIAHSCPQTCPIPGASLEWPHPQQSGYARLMLHLTPQTTHSQQHPCPQTDSIKAWTQPQHEHGITAGPELSHSTSRAVPPGLNSATARAGQYRRV